MTRSTRIASAKPEETAVLLVELDRALHSFSGDCRPLDYGQWLDRQNGFHQFLSTNTPESLMAAAMLLVPEGMRIDLRLTEDGRGAARLHWPGDIDLAAWGDLYPSLALALAAAIARTLP